MAEVTRTLVKSVPELWSECSDAGALGRHLGCFGEIKITRLEPETAVAWEGEHASGTVSLEPSGWGTRVVLTATPAAVSEPSPPAAVSEPSPPVAVGRRGLLARLRLRLRLRRGTGRRARRRGGAAQAVEPGAVEPRAMEPGAVEPAAAEPAAVEGTAAAEPRVLSDPAAPRAPEPPDPAQVLAAALDSLGRAHHRPFSRA